MYDLIELSVFYNNILTGYVKNQYLSRKELIRLIDTQPTLDDLDDNFVGLISSDDVAIFQAKRIDPNEWEIDVPIKISENNYKSISGSIDHSNLLEGMLNFYNKGSLFEIIHGKDGGKIKQYLKSEYYVW